MSTGDEVLKRSFAPVVTAETRLLILGSLPGDASLLAGEYYAHPQNQFWRLLAAVSGCPLAELGYEQRLAAVTALGIGLWDVVAEAKRQGSLDTAIREARPNALLQLMATLPALQAVAFNGKTAARALPALQHLPLDFHVLPSSSPAHTLAFSKKLAEWQLLDRYMQKQA